MLGADLVLEEILELSEEMVIPGLVTASSISSLELNSWSFKIPFNISKSQSHIGLCLVKRMGAEIRRRDVSRISASAWTDCDRLNCPCPPKSLTLASDDEYFGLPFLNPEKYNTRNIADCICDVLVGQPERLVSLQRKIT
jgi:hypothetical protein